MTDSKILDRITQRALDEGIQYQMVEPSSLRTIGEINWPKVEVIEGKTSKWADARAFNFMALAISDPKWTFETIRAEAPNNGESILSKLDVGIVNGRNPEAEVGNAVGSIRTRGFVKALGEIAGVMSCFSREENYHYRLFTSLVRSETQFNIGVNPLGPAKEFYVHKRGPGLLREPETDDGDDEPEVEVNSAADW